MAPTLPLRHPVPTAACAGRPDAARNDDGRQQKPPAAPQCCKGEGSDEADADGLRALVAGLGVVLDARARRLGERALAIVDEAVRGGFLPPAPREGACGVCDYRAACGSREEERALRKDAAPLAGLAELRGIP